MRRPRVFPALPALLALLAGCGGEGANPLQPEEVAGVYVLEKVDGAPLPSTLWNIETRSLHLTAETIRPGEDLTGAQTRAYRTDWSDPAKPDEAYGHTSPLTYALRGGRVEMSYPPCPENALCARGPHFSGRLEGDVLVVTDLNGAVLLYRRAAE